MPPIFEPQECEIEDEEEVMTTTTVDGVLDDLRQPFIDYFQHGRLPNDLKQKVDIRRRAPRFLYYHGTLFRRCFVEILLLCLSTAEAAQAVVEANVKVRGAHHSGAKLHFQIKRMEYYWPTLVKDCLDYARACKPCQYHANFIHHPQNYCIQLRQHGHSMHGDLTW
ncbi:hypothetical protein LIER_43529 [Lithospermum erythrorhizon]|uniref:Integrase zinc-binding domain-containing protein n=1 Tax=Lithospermum erythrorhizon TaxID=34254 RepID=A0AAV3Q921_LITER